MVDFGNLKILMSAIVYNYSCSDCGSKLYAPETPEMSYGLFVMRTVESGDAVYLDALNDPVFKESYELVKSHSLVVGLNSPSASPGHLK